MTRSSVYQSKSISWTAFIPELGAYVRSDRSSDLGRFLRACIDTIFPGRYSTKYLQMVLTEKSTTGDTNPHA
jgi:hypothetical protein